MHIAKHFCPEKYHKYGRWLRNDLKESVLERVNSGSIHALGIFNEKSLEQLIMSWQKANTDDTSRLDEVVSWLATLHEFINAYGILQPKEIYESSFKDSIRAAVGHIHAEAFVAARNRLRK